jgi:PTS system fructose-specific IIA component
MQVKGAYQIRSLLSEETVSIDLPGTTKAEVIDQLIRLIEGHPAVADPEGVRKAVLAREAMLSTGVGSGLGLPHAKTQAVTETVAAFALTREGIPFGAIDDLPVRMLFLLVGPTQAKTQHVKILSRISRMMNQDDFRRNLQEATSVDQVLVLFAEAEAALIEQ